MKKYLYLGTKLIVALLPLWGIWLYIYSYPVNYLNVTYTLFKWNKEFVSHSQNKKYDVVFLGDSYMNAAVVPELLSDSTVNLAQSVCSPVEAYYTLREFLENNPAPSVCYIAFCSNIMNLPSYPDSYFLLHRIGIKEALEISGEARRLAGNDICLENKIFKSYYESIDLVSWIKKALYFPDEFLPYLYNSRFNGRKSDNLHRIELTDIHRGLWASYTVYEDKHEKSILEEYKVQPMMDLYFGKIVELCKKNDIRIRIIDIPYPDSFTYANEYMDSFIGYYGQYGNDDNNLTVDPFFENYPSEFYGDGVHLNLHGAYRFSKKLKETYPEDFTENGEVSESTAAGISDYLSIENKGEYILYWIDEMDFTLMISFYEEPRESKFLTLLTEMYHYDGQKPEFNINGKRKKIEKVSAELSLRDRGERYVQNEIHKGNYIPDLKIIILDEYNKKVISEKNFIYNNREYRLLD